MEEIYANVDYDKSGDSVSANKTGPRTPEKRRFHGAIILCLCLLSVSLLAGLIGLSVHYHKSVHGAAAELSSIKANLTKLLQASFTKMSSLTAEKDQLNTRLSSLAREKYQLNTSLIRMTEERNKLQTLCSQIKTCPSGWTMFSYACYFLSGESGSWTKGRDDCRYRGADLVVIDSDEEQTFLSQFTSTSAWIGLSDMDTEGSWKWIDDTPLTLSYWARNQPDNGGGDPQWGEEDCAHFRVDPPLPVLWNDVSCAASLKWICEKNA